MRADLAITTHNRVISAKLPLTRPATTLPPKGEGFSSAFYRCIGPNQIFLPVLFCKSALRCK